MPAAVGVCEPPADSCRSDEKGRLSAPSCTSNVQADDRGGYDLFYGTILGYLNLPAHPQGCICLEGRIPSGLWVVVMPFCKAPLSPAQ